MNYCICFDEDYPEAEDYANAYYGTGADPLATLTSQEKQWNDSIYCGLECFHAETALVAINEV